ncbi:MAG: (2Fe-2S) ferredoxin domain-containing protein [Ruminococcaceae bacterium]|nr:(2Fe-2S) ferredoxin domain-containing protein [Oscillospiraceae bacterium]MBD5117335.1 (2Fe-2S) ferredoxin domain-containing protein [Oscillospiraceae bacterium]
MKTLEDLLAIKEKLQSQIDLRYEAHAHTRVVVCMGTSGIAAGARPVLTTFSDMVQEHKLKDISVTQTGSIGLGNNLEPIVEITTPKDGKVTYVKMDAEKAKKVVEQHLVQGNVVTEYTINN